MEWTTAEKDFVSSSRVARLATVNSEGIPHNVPVCPLLDGDKIYFGTEAQAKKVRNIKANRNVAIVLDDYTETWSNLRGIMVQGKARVVNTEEFQRVRQKIYSKYLQYESEAPLTEEDSVIVEITLQKKFNWGL